MPIPTLRLRCGADCPRSPSPLSLVLSFVAAIAVVGFNEVGYRRSAEAVGQVALHERVRLSLYALMQSMFDAETGERGYLLTRDVRFLDSYRRSTQQIDKDLTQARALLCAGAAAGGRGRGTRPAGRSQDR